MIAGHGDKELEIRLYNVMACMAWHTHAGGHCLCYADAAAARVRARRECGCMRRWMYLFRPLGLGRGSGAVIRVVRFVVAAVVATLVLALYVQIRRTCAIARGPLPYLFLAAAARGGGALVGGVVGLFAVHVNVAGLGGGR
jgi:hypothetical protein